MSVDELPVIDIRFLAYKVMRYHEGAAFLVRFSFILSSLAIALFFRLWV